LFVYLNVLIVLWEGPRKKRIEKSMFEAHPRKKKFANKHTIQFSSQKSFEKILTFIFNQNQLLFFGSHKTNHTQ
tara:strand:- start:44 stop:265 length:222 start_codon:yes stop_codon:yes gene_type:complete